MVHIKYSPIQSGETSVTWLTTLHQAKKCERSNWTRDSSAQMGWVNIPFCCWERGMAMVFFLFTFSLQESHSVVYFLPAQSLSNGSWYQMWAWRMSSRRSLDISFDNSGRLLWWMSILVNWSLKYLKDYLSLYLKLYSLEKKCEINANSRKYFILLV